jgi:hypothetical protein
MKHLVFDHENEVEHRHYVEELWKQLSEAGYFVSVYDVYCAWRAFSGSMSSNWMIPYDAPSDNVAMLLSYLVEVGEEEQ